MACKPAATDSAHLPALRPTDCVCMTTSGQALNSCSFAAYNTATATELSSALCCANTFMHLIGPSTNKIKDSVLTQHSCLRHSLNTLGAANLWQPQKSDEKRAHCSAVAS